MIRVGDRIRFWISSMHTPPQPELFDGYVCDIANGHAVACDMRGRIRSCPLFSGAVVVTAEMERSELESALSQLPG